MEIGIIGFGTFGRFISKHLKDKAKIIITDIVDRKKEAEKIGVEFGSLDKILKNKIIILAVPIESLEKTLHLIKNKLLPGTLVLDVSSVKIFPCKAMKKILPENIEIIGTHPVFGADSAPRSIKGMKIALCNIRSKKIEKVKKFCEDLGLEVFEVTPKKHDKQIAISQALTHFIGRVIEKMDIGKVDIATKTFEDLEDITCIIKNDSKVLFENLETINPFAKEIRKKFIEESKKLNDHLNKIEDERK